ncbi:MAG: hypothetical protein BroJett013_31830 [Alphaproteobacteria bacterium]|nr:MAG: hypothetical protein BroJett013_31830 [Alphaproteobacteria bacterium]
MRLFLDASVSPALAKALGGHGFDVVAQREVLPLNSSDLQVMETAFADGRVVLARDYDMAELALRGFANSAGVVIIAFDEADVSAEGARIASELKRLGESIYRAVHVIEVKRVRSRPFDLG